MFKDWSYNEVINKSDAILALGLNEIYLNKGEMPWEVATSCEPGGSHRLDIYTSVWFRGIESNSGISLRWSFDIENNNSPQDHHYHVDIEGCRKVLNSLKGNVRNQFQKYLADCSTSISKLAADYRKYAQEEQSIADD